VLGTSTRSRSRPKLFSGSRPSMGRDPKKISDREPNTVANQAVYPGKFSEKFLGRDPKNFLGRDRSRVATGIFFWIATDNGSRPEYFSGSRPITVRDRYFFLDRDRFLDFWVAIFGSMVPNTINFTLNL
jgi:hypothetical protein